jgi:hypothetical protein
MLGPHAQRNRQALTGIDTPSRALEGTGRLSMLPFRMRTNDGKHLRGSAKSRAQDGGVGRHRTRKWRQTRLPFGAVRNRRSVWTSRPALPRPTSPPSSDLVKPRLAGRGRAIRCLILRRERDDVTAKESPCGPLGLISRLSTALRRSGSVRKSSRYERRTTPAFRKLAGQRPEASLRRCAGRVRAYGSSTR